MPFKYTPYAVPAAFLGFNWFYAYGILSSRTIKQFYGIDHNSSPRQDLAKHADKAVLDGKLTRDQVDMIYRCEAASANSVEGFTFFVGAVLFAMQTKVPLRLINKACAVYTAARLIYGPLYIFISDDLMAQTRGLAWWTGNISCLFLLWQGATA